MLSLEKETKIGLEKKGKINNNVRGLPFVDVFPRIDSTLNKMRKVSRSKESLNLFYVTILIFVFVLPVVLLSK